jgi:predicted transcriptional regulator
VATSDPIELAADILSAFVSRNSVPRVELAALFEGLHASLKRLTDGEVAPPAVEPTTPAVSIRKSVTPDYLICLDDGLKFKSLRRHLTKLGMTPEQYRQKVDSAQRLSHGCVELRGATIGNGEEHRARAIAHETRRRRAGKRRHDRGGCTRSRERC